MYNFLIIKRIVENVFIFPFILLGKIIAYFNPLEKEYRIFFCFPFYHTGGAENVHAQITQTTGSSDCIIFFTRKSIDKRFLFQFQNSNCKILDISKFTDHKEFYFLNLIFRGIVSGYINKQKEKPIVFNGQCNFGYKISPWIKKNIAQIELIHSLNSFSFIRIPFLPFITKTIMISKKRIEDHQQLYFEKGIPAKFFERIIYIPNGISISETEKTKSSNSFTVLYSGRGSKEKRIYLLGQIAKELQKTNKDIQFVFMGDVSEFIAEVEFPFIKFLGNLNDEKSINEQYVNAAILLLTSDTEGFPMVVMEAMAKGCAIVATPVGDVQLHIINSENGFLFTSIKDEKQIVKEAVLFIEKLYNERNLLHQISINNIKYANTNFGLEKFQNSYRTLFASLK